MAELQAMVTHADLLSHSRGFSSGSARCQLSNPLYYIPFTVYQTLMYDHNVFAVLTAKDKRNKARTALALPENSIWFQPSVGRVTTTPTIRSRESTPALTDVETTGTGVPDRLIVTFDKLLSYGNLENGLQLGTNPSSSHILLGHRGTERVSSKQYNITVDDNLYIWLHDYHSLHGSAVGYSGQNQHEVRKNETWILAYAPGADNPFGHTTLHSGGLMIEIDFVNHTAAGPQYVENLQEFLGKCKQAAQKSNIDIPTLSGLGLSSVPATGAPTECQTSNNLSIYFHGHSLGKGEYGEVHKVIRTRDGKVLAAKMFQHPPCVNTKLDGKLPRNMRKLGATLDPVWLVDIQRVFAVMKENPHVSNLDV
jgi:hypothetical protein